MLIMLIVHRISIYIRVTNNFNNAEIRSLFPIINYIKQGIFTTPAASLVTTNDAG